MYDVQHHPLLSGTLSPVLLRQCCLGEKRTFPAVLGNIFGVKFLKIVRQSDMFTLFSSPWAQACYKDHAPIRGLREAMGRPWYFFPFLLYLYRNLSQSQHTCYSRCPRTLALRPKVHKGAECFIEEHSGQVLRETDISLPLPQKAFSSFLFCERILHRQYEWKSK